MLNLPFREVVALDFEFIAESGATPQPVCMVARELKSGRLHRLWADQLGTEPPFPHGDDVLIVAYFASAEVGCYLALGWPVPARILDLYTEFRNRTNATALPAGRGLLGALAYHGIPSITSEQKTAERALVMRGGPWNAAERRQILDYCQTDVDVLPALLERMLPAILARTHGLGHALLRGRYMAAVARMERTGVPLDTATLGRLRQHWQDIKRHLIAAIDVDYGVFEKTTFKDGLFAAYLVDHGIDWPRTPTGRLQVDRDTFKDMAKTYPQLEPLRQLRIALAELRLEKIAVGPDGRNRLMLSPFGAASGRNTPSANRFIFGPSVWLRGLIKPPAGRALAYIDWSSQEVYIAAKLSGDPALLAAVESGDPYLAFAKMAGLAPDAATKVTHRAVRDLCKTAVLGTNYGMGASSLAIRTGISVIEAEDILRRLGRTFPAYSAWADHVSDLGQLAGHLSTVFGWTMHTQAASRATTLRNFPMQAHGAEILRLACSLATEAGVQVCAPVHDALLIEADADAIDAEVQRARQAMDQASSTVLDGLVIPTDVETICHPDRYADPRGAVMWERVTKILDQLTDPSCARSAGSAGSAS